MRPHISLFTAQAFFVQLAQAREFIMQKGQLLLARRYLCVIAINVTSLDNRWGARSNAA